MPRVTMNAPFGVRTIPRVRCGCLNRLIGNSLRANARCAAHYIRRHAARIWPNWNTRINRNHWFSLAVVHTVSEGRMCTGMAHGGVRFVGRHRTKTRNRRNESAGSDPESDRFWTALLFEAERPADSAHDVRAEHRIVRPDVVAV